MALVERLAILIDANSSGATREFKKLSGEVKNTDAAMTKTQAVTKKAGAAVQAFGVLAVTAGAAGIAKFADASIDAASALEEARSKAQVVFGDGFRDVKRFAEDTANALNLSERAAFQFTSAFGQLFDSAGLEPRQITEYSTTLATLAADLASFNDLSVDEAFQKLRSGLSGEAEPLRQVGVFLSAAKVEAEAYESGIAKAGSTLTEAQKIQARYNIILRETATAQGDVERTSESLANRQRDLAESTEDLQASLGEDLAPIKAEFLGVLAQLADGVSALDDVFRDAEGSAGGLYKNLAPISVLMRVLSGDIGDEFAAAAGDGADKTADLNDELARISGSLGNIGFEQAAESVDDFRYASRGTIDELRQLPPAVDDTTLASKGLLDELSNVAGALDDMPTPTRKYLDEVLKVAPATDDFAAASRGLLDVLPPLESATDDLAPPTYDLAGGFESLYENADEAADAVSVLKDVVSDMRSPVLDVRDANREFSDSIQRYHDVMQDGESTLSEQEQALDDIADAAFGVLDANADAEAGQKTLRDETARLRDELIKAKSKYDENATAAENYAREVGLIPDSVTTNVALYGINTAIDQARTLAASLNGINVSTAYDVVQKDRAMAARRASGGPVGPNTYLVGEQGPELLTMRGTGTVMSNAKTRVADMDRGGDTYNITVTTGEPKMAAAEVVSKLRAQSFLMGV